MSNNDLCDLIITIFNNNHFGLNSIFKRFKKQYPQLSYFLKDKMLLHNNFYTELQEFCLIGHNISQQKLKCKICRKLYSIY